MLYKINMGPKPLLITEANSPTNTPTGNLTAGVFTDESFNSVIEDSFDSIDNISSLETVNELLLEILKYK